MNSLSVLSLCLVVLQLGPRAAAQPDGSSPARKIQRTDKKLIEFGWDEPDTAFMRHRIREMEQSPFDGCVFHVNFVDRNSSAGSFTWQGWGDRAFSEADLKTALEDLRATPFQKFTHNFLRFNTAPAKLDWFDDYSAVITNARLAALVAREGKCRGILFDIEQYEGPLFDYRKQRDRETKSWELYAAQARRRGREVMEAFQQGFPGLTIFLTFGYSLPWHETRQGKASLAECHYGLLAPFLDGMLEAAREDVPFVDGHELSYGYKEAARFDQAYTTMQQHLLPIVAAPGRYRHFFSFGFGLWMDNQWRQVGWDTEDFSRNYFFPESFEASVRRAIAVADEYVWIYTESPRWWSKEGKPTKLPDAYAQAVRRARDLKASADRGKSDALGAGPTAGDWLQRWSATNRVWRGVHVMVGSSNAASDLVAELPELAALGVNALVLEINHGFAFESHPELRNANALTKEQARRLASECRARGIRPIPLFNCLGHQSWSRRTGPLLTKYPELDETPGQFPENQDIYCRSWCPQHPKVNEIVFGLLDELIAGFEADAVHVGMDEVFLIASEHCPRCRGGDPAKLFAKAVNDLHNHLVGHREVEMLMWADRLLEAATMGYGRWESATNGTHRAVDLIPKDVILCDWHYEEPAKYPGKLADYGSIPFLLEKGFRVWPGGWKNVRATEALLEAERKHAHERLLGHLCTTWGAVKIRDLAEWPPIRAATGK